MSEAAPRRSRKWRVTYRIGVHIGVGMVRTWPNKVLQKTVILIINYNSIETFKSRSREDQSPTLPWLVIKHFETKNKVLYAGKLQRVRFPHSPIHLGGLIKVGTFFGFSKQSEDPW